MAVLRCLGMPSCTSSGTSLPSVDLLMRGPTDDQIEEAAMDMDVSRREAKRILNLGYRKYEHDYEFLITREVDKPTYIEIRVDEIPIAIGYLNSHIIWKDPTLPEYDGHPMYRKDHNEH